MYLACWVAEGPTVFWEGVSFVTGELLDSTLSGSTFSFTNMLRIRAHVYTDKDVCINECIWILSDGYNFADMVYLWRRGKSSISGITTLKLQQFNVGSFNVHSSFARYETGKTHDTIFSKIVLIARWFQSIARTSILGSFKERLQIDVQKLGVMSRSV